MKLAVVGCRGMLGQEFMALLLDTAEQYGTHFEATGFHRENLDLEASAQELAQALAGFDAIVNCVAYTAVDKAETEESLALSGNAEIPAKLAAVAKITGAHLIHFSTDYVFDGKTSAPYSTNAKRDPQTAYGRTKAAGEVAIEDSGASYTLIRTAWLYGAFGKCFPKTIANLLESRGHLNIVSDQTGQPTWTRDLAQLTLKLLAAKEAGKPLPTHVHGVSSGQATWFDFAGAIAEAIGMDAATVLSPVTTTDFPTPASRPAYSVLNNELPRELGVEPIGNWRDRWLAAAESILAAR